MKDDFSDVFIAIYTHECKSYCDEKFFKALGSSEIKKAQVRVVDNSLASSNYAARLTYLTHSNPLIDIKIHHIEVDRTDKKTLFHRNVRDSVNYLRSLFLQSDCKYFVIVESDVLVPSNWLECFKEVENKADIIGGIYYEGFHTKEEWNSDAKLFPTIHVLSGCTLYHRSLIEQIPFRIDLNQLNCFPDALICIDAKDLGYKFCNYSKIKCIHAEKGTKNRGLSDLK